MTDRTTVSAGDGWDADVLDNDPTRTGDAPEAGSVSAWSDAAGDDATDDAAEAPEVEALVVEIEATRSEMAGTVEELGDRLDPATIADRAKDRVREATIGTIETKVNNVTNAASDFASDAGRTAQDAGSGLIETIKANPVPAAMAGLGLGWLILNRRSGQRSSWGGSWSTGDRRGYEGNTIRDRYRPGPGDDLRRKAADLPDAFGRRIDDAGEAVGDAASNARRAAGDAVDTVGQTAGEAATTVSRTATDFANNAQRALEQNPIAFGAIAVAVGTAVGLALPATDAEKRVMGGAGSQLIDRAQTAVSEPLQEMEAKAGR
jgi:ElaB/YqjD/DUF883 family membrane-anchored ribosome-binding protein